MTGNGNYAYRLKLACKKIREITSSQQILGGFKFAEVQAKPAKMQMRHLKFDEWVISVILVVSFVYV